MGKSCSSRSQCVKPMPETDLNKEEVVNIDCLNGNKFFYIIIFIIKTIFIHNLNYDLLITGKCSCAQDYILTEDNTDCIRYSENGK